MTRLDEFFSEQHLSQIDRLHALLFPWIREKEKSLHNRLENRVKMLAKEKSWHFKKGSVNQWFHLGLVHSDAKSTWPPDLWFHIGWHAERSLLHGNPWVGVYTSDGYGVAEQLWTVMTTCFEKPQRQPGRQPGSGYPIFQDEEPWPKINVGSIEPETRLVELLDLINGWDQRVEKIVSRLERMIGCLNQQSA
jgi:hypothetical protein